MESVFGFLHPSASTYVLKLCELCHSFSPAAFTSSLWLQRGIKGGFIQKKMLQAWAVSYVSWNIKARHKGEVGERWGCGD